MRCTKGIVASGRTGGASLIDPLSLGWDHAWWASGPEFIALGYSDTDSVTTWPDEIGSLDATNGSTSAILDVDGLGGQPSVVFGASNGLVTAALATAITQPYSVVMILDFASTAGIRQAMDGRTASPRIQVVLSSSKFAIAAGVGLFSDGAADTNQHLHTAYFNGSSSVYEIDGTAQTATNAGTLSLPGATFGARYDNSNGMVGGIAFIGWAAGDIRTDPLWADFETWAASTYGITIS